MNTLLELVREEQFEERPVTLRKLLQSHNAGELTVRALFASHEMLVEYLNTPRWLLALGPHTGGITKNDSGYEIPVTLGFLQKPKLSPLDEPPFGPTQSLWGSLGRAVDLAAVKCFGTEDPGNLCPNEDETYAIISIFTLLPGEQVNVVTKNSRRTRKREGRRCNFSKYSNRGNTSGLRSKWNKDTCIIRGGRGCRCTRCPCY